jgi:protein SCO1/2
VTPAPRTHLLALAVAAALAATLVAWPISRADADTTVPKELEGIGIEERPGAKAPLDLAVRDHLGRSVTLGKYFNGTQPVLLVMAYYQCPMLCSLVVNGVTAGMRALAWTTGDKYRVVVVSFDPRDTVELAAAKRKNYLESYGRQVDDDAWPFLLADEKNARRLAQAIGFGYRWDAETQQYAHAAGAFVFTPDGRLSRTLYGITYEEKNLRLALLEAAGGKLGSAWDKVLLFCFHYDPNARSYVPATMRIVKASGVATVVLLALFLGRLWRRERLISKLATK